MKMFIAYCIIAGGIFYISDDNPTILGSLGKGFGFGYNQLSQEYDKLEDNKDGDFKELVNDGIKLYDSTELGTTDEFKEEFKKEESNE